MPKGDHDYSLAEIWGNIEKVMNAQPEPYKDLQVIYQFQVTGRKEKEVYQLQLQNGRARVMKDAPGEADCTLIMPDRSFKKMLLGQLNGTAAYMTGKLKVKGSLGLALKLQNLLSQYDVKAHM
ncbi:MAG TPA: SCP2 sterol-binding domain-containing protein [Bacillales bacterium]|nr:SCP2 sterol-binding domain-containing protein [Bacillales bacterium]